MCVSCIMGELGLPALKYGSEIVRKLGSPSVRGLGFAREWTVCPFCGNRRLTIYWSPEPASRLKRIAMLEELASASAPDPETLPIQKHRTA